MSVIEVIKEVKTLSRAEKRRVWQELNEIVSEDPIELRLQRALSAEGLLTEIKMPFISRPEQKEVPPIKIKGKPLSETIIEERR
jgi:NRPS condensation-like uncharacterized protein